MGAELRHRRSSEGIGCFTVSAKQLAGLFQVEESTFGGLIGGTWNVPAIKMTGTNPILVFGGRIDAGYVGSLNGYMDNIYIWKRCLE